MSVLKCLHDFVRALEIETGDSANSVILPPSLWISLARECRLLGIEARVPEDEERPVIVLTIGSRALRVVRAMVVPADEMVPR